MNSRMRQAVVAAALLSAFSAAGETQVGPPAQGKSFEVASLRLSDPKGGGLTSLSSTEAAHFTATNASLVLLLEMAYGVDEAQIVGKPGWADGTLYDVTAKPEGNSGVKYELFKPMMQNLLAERLHLVVHRETKTMKGYVLVVAKEGPKLKAAAGDRGGVYILNNGMRAGSISMGVFAAMLTRGVGRPTVDKTGLTGNYQITLDYAPAGSSDSTLPSLFTALQEQLGLKLETTEVPVSMLVIDHVDREPVEN